MNRPQQMTDAERLEALAEWFDYAAAWLQQEVDDSRATAPANDEAPECRVERVAFITSELDAMVTGFRRAADMMKAITGPLPAPSPR